MAVDEIDLALQFLEKGHSNKNILLSKMTHFKVMPDNLRKDKKILEFFRRVKLID